MGCGSSQSLTSVLPSSPQEAAEQPVENNLDVIAPDGATGELQALRVQLEGLEQQLAAFHDVREQQAAQDGALQSRVKELERELAETTAAKASYAAALQLRNEELEARQMQQASDDAVHSAASERLREMRATEISQERVDAAQAVAKAEHIIVIGNPGGGKSTLLNSLMKSLCGFSDVPVFESGISCLHGLTTECKRHECNNELAFVDTPGLADVSEREHAAEQISAALSMPAMCKIIFVVAFIDLEPFHMRSEDWAALQLVIESLLEANVTVEELNFAVVFNKVPKGKGAFEPLEVVAKLSSGEVEKKISTVNQICIDEDPELEDATGMLKLSDEFVEFIKNLPCVCLGKQKVNIKHDKFEQLIKKHRMEIEALQQTIKNNTMPEQEDLSRPQEEEDKFEPEEEKEMFEPEQQEDPSEPEKHEDTSLSKRQENSAEPGVAFKKRRILCIGNAGAGTTKIKETMKESVAPAEKDKFEFFEAKGLADTQSRKKNAMKINSLLKSNCEYSIFFVLTLQAGRLRPEDRETIQLVRHAVPVIGNRYSVIINKMTEQSMGMFESPEKFEQLGGKLFFKPACKDKEKSTIHFIKKNTNGKPQLPWQFWERCPSLNIREDHVLAVNFETLEDQAEQLREELDKLKKASTTLEEEYEAWKNYIDCSEIRWIKVGYLQELTQERKRLPRCQDLEEGEYEVGSRGNFQDDCVHISRWVVSHPWRSPRHPDPDGVQLQWVCKELRRFCARDDDLLFYDYAGLLQNDNFNEDFWNLCCHRFEQKKRGLPDTEWTPWPEAGGHPAVRTKAEESLFKDTQLRKLELLFCFRGMKVLIAPIPPYADQQEGVMLGGDCPANPRMYKDRGWCLFEYAVASVFHRIVNVDHEDVKKFCDVEVNDPYQFSNAFSKVEFTNNGDRQVVIDMFNRIFESRPELIDVLGPGRDALSANEDPRKLQELMDGGHNITELKEAGFTMGELKEFGFTIRQMREGGLFGQAGATLPGTDKYYCCTLGPDGIIYGIPWEAEQVLAFDPKTQTSELVGAKLPGVGKYRCCTLGPDGIIYGIPCIAEQVLAFDPKTQTSKLVGAKLPGRNKYDCCTLGPDGIIYGIPCSAEHVLAFDPKTQTSELVGAKLPGTNKYFCCTLGPDGIIYGIPAWDAEHVLAFDPKTQTSKLVGARLPGTNKYHCCTLGPDGIIYGIPWCAEQVLAFDPQTQTSKLIGAKLAGSYKYLCCTLGPDGIIYGIPVEAEQVLACEPSE